MNVVHNTSNPKLDQYWEPPHEGKDEERWQLALDERGIAQIAKYADNTTLFFVIIIFHMYLWLPQMIAGFIFIIASSPPINLIGA